jgi:hypothetical protein
VLHPGDRAAGPAGPEAALAEMVHTRSLLTIRPGDGRHMEYISSHRRVGQTGMSTFGVLAPVLLSSGVRLDGLHDNAVLTVGLPRLPNILRPLRPPAHRQPAWRRGEAATITCKPCSRPWGPCAWPLAPPCAACHSCFPHCSPTSRCSVMLVTPLLTGLVTMEAGRSLGQHDGRSHRHGSLHSDIRRMVPTTGCHA